MHSLSLTLEQKWLHLEWEAWTDEEWCRIMLRMNLGSALAQMTIVCAYGSAEGEDQSCQCCGETHHITPGLMVWGALEYVFRSPLVVVQGTLLAWGYISKVLRSYV